MQLSKAGAKAIRCVDGAAEPHTQRVGLPLHGVVCVGIVVLWLAACATQQARPPQLPSLRLDPALLTPGAWSQRLVFEHGAQSRPFDALLEIDGSELRLVALSGPQEAFRLRWDGQRLEVRKADWMPPDFRVEWVLDDLHLSLWPLEPLRTALPDPWTLDATESGRVLLHDGREVVRIRSVDGLRHIEHPLQGYRLQVDSRVLE